MILARTTNHGIRVINIALLAVAFTELPYGYYQFVRLVIFVSAVIFAYQAFTFKQKQWVFIWMMLGLLYNPIFPVHLNKEIWLFLNGVAISIFLWGLLAKDASLVAKAPGVSVQEDDKEIAELELLLVLSEMVGRANTVLVKDLVVTSEQSKEISSIVLDMYGYAHELTGQLGISPQKTDLTGELEVYMFVVLLVDCFLGEDFAKGSVISFSNQYYQAVFSALLQTRLMKIGSPEQVKGISRYGVHDELRAANEPFSQFRLSLFNVKFGAFTYESLRPEPRELVDGICDFFSTMVLPHIGKRLFVPFSGSIDGWLSDDADKAGSLASKLDLSKIELLANRINDMARKDIGQV